ncbi:MAG TPA: periplasmic heavy metal sensor [Burkholderiales bacterium]|nr:periplasmic heavy metal sensor [Burkholderiales bacterium]
MKTSRVIPAVAAAAVFLGAGILFSAAALRTDRTSSATHVIFNQQLHKQLNLLPDQERQWQALKDEEELLRKKINDSRAQLRGVADAEFAKTRPDLAALSGAADAVREQNYAVRRDFHKHALAFYSSLSPEQQLAVINTMKEKRRQNDRVLEKKDSSTKTWKVNV